MKKLTLLLALGLVVSSSYVMAQTAEQKLQITSNYDLEKLQQLELQYVQEYEQKRDAAHAIAAARGWALTKTDANGEIALLVDVLETGEPIYIGVHNREGGITTRANLVHSGGSSGLDLNGENMLIGIWDGGRVRSTHQLLENRSDQQDSPDGFSSHATHVAGTMIGTGDVASGFAKGMAPEAELLAYDFNNNTGELANAVANEALLVSNHSYGAGIDGVPLWYLGYYDNSARAFDNIAYNAPYHLAVVSAGNDRQSGVNNGDGGYDYLTDKGNAKNVITSAATNEVLNYTGPGSVVMSNFSSWGPTDDGRIKPDLAAKGVNMYSSVSTSNSNYANFSGTSMSSPNTTGSLALLQQHYNDVNGEFMLSSTLRGLALHTADEAGNNPGPDGRFGWGLMNTARAADVITNNGNESLILEETLAEGQTFVMTVTADGINDLLGSVTWTDPAATPGAQGVNDAFYISLVNDLDLRISEDGGATFFPWKLDVANPADGATQGDNVVDNIERVDVTGASGDYIVEITHKGTITNDVQVFSLILTGIDLDDYSYVIYGGEGEECEGVDTMTVEVMNFGYFNGFNETFAISVVDTPAGVTATPNPTSVNATGTVDLDLSGLSGLAFGSYTVEMQATSPSLTVNFDVTIDILEEEAVAAASPSGPPNGSVDVPLNFPMSWSAESDNTLSYIFELATDDAFTNIVATETTDDTAIIISDKEYSTEYFWRVRAIAVCSESDLSEVFSFTTEELLGTEDITIDGLAVYPNPTNGDLTIRANDVIGTVEVINLLGQTLVSHDLNATEGQIDLSGLSNGNYFVRVTANNSVNVLQVVKQ